MANFSADFCLKRAAYAVIGGNESKTVMLDAK